LIFFFEKKADRLQADRLNLALFLLHGTCRRVERKCQQKCSKRGPGSDTWGRLAQLLFSIEIDPRRVTRSRPNFRRSWGYCYMAPVHKRRT